MPTIEGREGRVWIDAYVKKAGKLAGVARSSARVGEENGGGLRRICEPMEGAVVLIQMGPLCCFVLGKEHVTLAFLRGAALPDPEKLLEGQARFVRNVRLRSMSDVKRPGVKEVNLRRRQG